MPWPPSLFSTSTLSTYTFMASSLVDVNVVGPGTVTAIMPVQRAPKFVVGTLGPNELLLAGLLLPKAKVPASPEAAATAAVWKPGVPLMADVLVKSSAVSWLVVWATYLLASPL